MKIVIKSDILFAKYIFNTLNSTHNYVIRLKKISLSLTQKLKFHNKIIRHTKARMGDCG